MHLRSSFLWLYLCKPNHNQNQEIIRPKSLGIVKSLRSLHNQQIKVAHKVHEFKYKFARPNQAANMTKKFKG